ncbi:MAG TPA: SPFH domain-containing protein [Acidobacteriota bacterium]|nr:SPFH domain-containing protein [Acidobacteriota bacterium]
MISFIWLYIAGIIIVLLGIRIVQQYESGLVFTLGKYSGKREAGLTWIIPVIQHMTVVDMRLLAVDIPKQQIMTKDNVPIHANGVVFYKVVKSEDAIIKIQDYQYAITMYAQTALRDVLSGMTLDSVLTERQKIGDEIRAIVDKETEAWGLDVNSIKLQDIEVPDDLKRIMSRQAAAEREKRANIIKSEGDKEAAKNLAAAAQIMGSSTGAMQLRTLQTLDGLGPTASNTVVMALPVEVMEFFSKFRGKKK